MCSICGCPEHHEHRDGGAHGACADVRGQERVRILKLSASVLEENVKYAEQNRRYLRERSICMLNLVSSPGAGKTTLLARSIRDLKDHFTICVIEGDQQTIRDAERIASTGVEVVQINTGKACHLDARLVGRALEELKLEKGGILFVENVGNLVCPAGVGVSA